MRHPRLHGLLILFVIAWLGGAASRALASQSVELSWNQSTSPNIVAYTIYYGTQSHEYPDSITVADISDVTIPGLAGGQTYYFAAAAIDASGYESPLSNEAVYTTTAPASIGLQAQSTTAALEAVQLSWTPSPDIDVYGYSVNYGLQSGVYTNSAMFYYTTNGIISGLAGGVTYYFSVSPIDSYGVEAVASGEVSYTIPVSKPVVLQAQEPADSSGVELTWNAIQNEGIASYNIYYGTESGDYIWSVNCGSTNEFIVHGLDPGQVYYFAVAPVDVYGNQGGYSNEAISPAAAPVPVAAQVQGATSALGAVVVSWTASSDSDIYGYAVEYWTPGAGSTNTDEFYSGTDGIVSGLTGGATYYFAIAPIDTYGIEAVASSVISYTVPVSTPIVLRAQEPADSSGVELTWNAIQNDGVVSYNIYYGTASGDYTESVNCGSTNEFIVHGLTAGQTYYFVVAPVDEYGNQGGYSSEASSPAAAPIPVAFQVQGTTAALEAVEVSWTLSTDSDVDGYAVQYWTPGAGYTNVTDFYYTTDGMISGLTGGATYYFAIAPIGSYGVEAIASSVVSYTVPVSTPIVLQAQALTNSPGVELTWNAVPNEGVVGYNVYYGTTSGSYPSFAGYVTANNFVVRGLEGGQTYYFAVTAEDGSGDQGGFSSEASVIAPLPAPMILQMQIYTDGNGQPYQMEIHTPSTVYGNWELDYSTDLQNWTPYTYGYGPGNGDGYDVDVYVSIDPTQPQVFYRVIN
jgi:fibronectin type 3 domain-containing protein